jgi:hypothetical protein
VVAGTGAINRVTLVLLLSGPRVEVTNFAVRRTDESHAPTGVHMSKIKSPHDTSEHGKVHQDTPTREAPTTDEERIDESLDESFPASDPPAVKSITKK